jgi:hypothetical protein
VLLKPLADAGNRTLVCVRRGVRAMENVYLAEEDNSYAATLALADLRLELLASFLRLIGNDKEDSPVVRKAVYLCASQYVFRFLLP